jgi:hypothetical protein
MHNCTGCFVIMSKWAVLQLAPILARLQCQQKGCTICSSIFPWNWLGQYWQSLNIPPVLYNILKTHQLGVTLSHSRVFRDKGNFEISPFLWLRLAGVHSCMTWGCSGVCTRAPGCARFTRVHLGELKYIQVHLGVQTWVPQHTRAHVGAIEGTRVYLGVYVGQKLGKMTLISICQK